MIIKEILIHKQIIMDIMAAKGNSEQTNGFSLFRDW